MLRPSIFPLRRYLPLAMVPMAVACVSRTRPLTPREVTAVGASGGTDEVQSLVQLALMLDAAADRQADTLYAPDAVVIGNARVRLAAPRFAGVAYGGRVTITASNATVEGRVAWVLVDYRWSNPAERRTEAGRATIICERRSSGWKIVHVHSSQPLPWEPS